MKLNRYNYEEYFILYLDNELDSEGCREVEAFLLENPDLKAELDIFTQSKLTPDTDISFADKGSLLRFDNSSISLANYEEWLTAYIDDEVTSEQRSEIEQFVASNPAVLNELNLLKRVKLQPETIVFPDKESLYRKTEKAKVISIRWIRVAVAALLLFAVGTTAIVMMNNKKSNGSNDGSTAKNKTESPKIKSVEANDIQQPIVNPKTNSSKNQIAVAADNKTNKLSRNEARNAIAAVNPNTTETKEQSGLTKEDTEIVVLKKPTNNLPQPIANADLNSGDRPNPRGNVTFTPDNSSDNRTGNPEFDFASNDSGNKGIRGFLRKVTRTIEKRTNIKTTDDDGRLLIAGLAIKTN